MVDFGFVRVGRYLRKNSEKANPFEIDLAKQSQKAS
jgi:hypothetical protein